jgi:hypothetical protein
VIQSYLQTLSGAFPSARVENLTPTVRKTWPSWTPALLTICILLLNAYILEYWSHSAPLLVGLYVLTLIWTYIMGYLLTPRGASRPSRNTTPR